METQMANHFDLQVVIGCITRGNRTATNGIKIRQYNHDISIYFMIFPYILCMYHRCFRFSSNHFLRALQPQFGALGTSNF